MVIGHHIDFACSGKHGTKSYTQNAMLSKNVCPPSWNANLRSPRMIALVMDIRAFLSSKAAEPSEQGSNKTTKTPTLKRGSGDSGSSTSQSSSKWKLVRTWLNKPSMAHVQFWSKCYLQPDVTDSEEVLYSWSLFCWVQWNNKLWLLHFLMFELFIK